MTIPVKPSSSSSNSSTNRGNTSGNSAREELANAPDLDIENADPTSYNCYGNGIGKQVLANPTGYERGDSTRETFEAVVMDWGGEENVRELNSINDEIGDDEFMVAMKCGPYDYHFIRLDSNGWYNKSGTTTGVFINQSLVSADIWYPIWQENGNVYSTKDVFYDDETIYFAVKKGWDD